MGPGLADSFEENVVKLTSLLVHFFLSLLSVLLHDVSMLASTELFVWVGFLVVK